MVATAVPGEAASAGSRKDQRPNPIRRAVATTATGYPVANLTSASGLSLAVSLRCPCTGKNTQVHHKTYVGPMCFKLS